MTYDELLTDHEGRQRLIDLAFSLHECLGDFVTDCERLKYDNSDINMATLDRISQSCMNCLADMDLLRAPFQTLAAMRFDSTRS